MLTLVERLNQLDNISYSGLNKYMDVKKRLVDALLIPNVQENAPSRYFGGFGLLKINGERSFEYRDRLCGNIASYLNIKGVDLGIDFPKKLYLSFKPRTGYQSSNLPLLYILNGRIGGDNVPNEIYEKLDDWESMYFLAGIWHGRTCGYTGFKHTAPHLNAWPISKIVANTIELGIKELKRFEETLGKKLPHVDIILEQVEKITKPQMKLYV